MYLHRLLHRSSSRPEDVALWAEVEKVGACEEAGQASRQLARSMLGVAHDACRACRSWCSVSARLHGSGFALVLSSFGLNSEALHESLVLSCPRVVRAGKLVGDGGAAAARRKRESQVGLSRGRSKAGAKLNSGRSSSLQQKCVSLSYAERRRRSHALVRGGLMQTRLTRLAL